MIAPLTSRQIWTMPIILSIVIGVGLLSALLGDGAWDVVSWFALGAPVMMIVWFIARRS